MHYRIVVGGIFFSDEPDEDDARRTAESMGESVNKPAVLFAIDPLKNTKTVHATWTPEHGWSE